MANCGCDFDSCGNLRHMCGSCSAISRAGYQSAYLSERIDKLMEQDKRLEEATAEATSLRARLSAAEERVRELERLAQAVCEAEHHLPVYDHPQDKEGWGEVCFSEMVDLELAVQRLRAALTSAPSTRPADVSTETGKGDTSGDPDAP